MNLEELESGYYRITVDGGRVLDTRTQRTYKQVICSERNLRFFVEA